MTDTSIAEIERRLDDLREHESTSQRTSVLTHVAWVPPEWSRAAGRVLEGMGARVPSRTILLHPDPGATTTRLDADVDHECFPLGGRETCAELARIWLRGETAKAPASVVVPLQIPDLPAFLRWRGRPPFGTGTFDQLVSVSDRLVVDSAEWGGSLPTAYRRLAGCFDRIAVSDLAWARSLGFRAGLAALWPAIRHVGALRVEGPRADALLLRGWLRSRLKLDLRLRVVEAPALVCVEADGTPVRPPGQLNATASDLLSAELEAYGRDRVYEAAVHAV